MKPDLGSLDRPSVWLWMMGSAGIKLAGFLAYLVVVCGWCCLKDRRCAREPSLGWRVAVLPLVVSRFLSVVAVCGGWG